MAARGARWARGLPRTDSPKKVVTAATVIAPESLC
jgi:hypothetical protein